MTPKPCADSSTEVVGRLSPDRVDTLKDVLTQRGLWAEP